MLGVARIEAAGSRARAHPVRPRPPARPPAGRREGAPARMRAGSARARGGVRQPRRPDDERAGASGLVASRLRGARQAPGDTRRARSTARLRRSTTGESRAITHVQSDDEVSVERAVSQFIPRLEAPEVRTTDSWIRVADPVFDRDREAHGRFARELSDRLGAVTIALGARRGGRSLPHLRARPDGRRVPVGADLVRRAPEGRRARARRQPDARLAPDRRLARRGAAGRAHGARRRRSCRPPRSSTSRSRS